MIIDKINNIERYKLGFQFIIEDLLNRPFQKGKIDLASLDYYGIGLEYNTQDEEKGVWEAHRQYLDVHIILEGEEFVHISDINNMNVVKEYIENDDYLLFEGEKEQKICLRKGRFLILYPNEVHKTAIKVNQSLLLRKYVLKVKI